MDVPEFSAHLQCWHSQAGVTAIARNVVITGIGFVAAAPFHEVLAGTLAAPPAPPPEITAFEIPEGAPAWGFEVLDFSLEKELPNLKSFVDRTSALALGAAKFALADAGLVQPDQRPAGAEIGCAYGTTLGCLEAMGIFWHKVKSSNPKFAPPLPFTHGYANSPASLLCIEFGLRGPAAAFSGEGLAGMEALLFAFDQIAAGTGEIILAGASESLTQAAWSHLFATGQLSRSGKWDDGIVPGEGAAMLVLESDESARRRGASIHAKVEKVEFLAPSEVPAAVMNGIRARVALQFSRGPIADPAFFSGDALSVLPVLGAAAAAGVLSGRFGRGTGGFMGTALPSQDPDLATVRAIETDGSHALLTLARCSG